MCSAVQTPLVCGLILAAGLSSRMGDFKPLMPLRGKTLIENTVDSAFDGGAASVTVVVGYRGDELSALLKARYGERIHIAWNHDYATTDMLESVRIGCQALPSCDGFFLLPGDMPAVSQETFQKLVSAWSTDTLRVIFPTLDGYRKHPPFIDFRLVPELLAYHGEGGLRGLWRQHEDWILTVPVDDGGVWMDLDTRTDYETCRKIFEKSIRRETDVHTAH